MDVEEGVLAYVFWHWPRPGTDVEAYEGALTEFQDRLRGAGVPDLRGVTTFRLGRAPWGDEATPPSPLYEDWYVVSGFAALEHLSIAAVSDELGPSHDRAAVAAEGGTAGLYALRRAAADPAATVAHWLTKPVGMSYAALDALLESEAPTGSLWQRQLSLGPGAEFCLAAPDLVTFPRDLTAHIILREPLDRR